MRYEDFPTYERLDALRQEVRDVAAADPARNENAPVGPGSSLTWAELRCLLEVCETFYKSQLPERQPFTEEQKRQLGMTDVDHGIGEKS